MFNFKLPPQEDRVSKPSYAYGLFNMAHGSIEAPQMYFCSQFIKLHHFLSMIFVVIALIVYLMHRHFDFLPDLMADSGAENYFEFYRYLIDFSGPLTIVIAFGFLFWLRTHYSFKDYDYTKYKPAVEGTPELKFGSPTFEFLGMICLFFIFMALTSYPSFSGMFFYKERYYAYFVHQFDKTGFIICAAIFMWFWHQLTFHVFFLSTTYILSARYRLKLTPQ